MLSYNESLKILKETNALLEGHFILSSGLHSKYYIQCARLLSHPRKAKIFCSSLCEKIKKEFNKIDIILSPAIGGIVAGYEVGRQMNLETIFAERSDGQMKLRRGFKIPNKSNVLIVEDVITTGKSVLECYDLIKEGKSKLVGYSCIIDRTGNQLSIKEKIISQIKLNIKTYKSNELPDDLKKIKPIKPGSRDSYKWRKENLA